MKKILFSLLVLSMYAQDYSDESGDETDAATLAQNAEQALNTYTQDNPSISDDEGAAASTSAQAAARPSHRCPIEGCEKSFATAGHLTRHIRTKHNEPPAKQDSAPKRQRLESVSDSDDESEEELEIDTEYSYKKN